LIARQSDLIVFCEVKARRTAGYGGAAAAVDQRKQQRLRDAASVWLADNNLSDLDARFDVITIVGVVVEHYEAAF
jgi:putative endonuclease